MWIKRERKRFWGRGERKRTFKWKERERGRGGTGGKEMKRREGRDVEERREGGEGNL